MLAVFSNHRSSVTKTRTEHSYLCKVSSLTNMSNLLCVIEFQIAGSFISQPKYCSKVWELIQNITIIVS